MMPSTGFLEQHYRERCAEAEGSRLAREIREAEKSTRRSRFWVAEAWRSRIGLYFRFGTSAD